MATKIDLVQEPSVSTCIWTVVTVVCTKLEHFFVWRRTESLLYKKHILNKIKTPWLWSVGELYWSSDRCWLAKLVPTFPDRGCRVVSATDPHGCNFDFLDRSHYCFFQVSPQLSSRGWVDPVPDPLLFRKSGSTGNRTQDPCICSIKHWPLDYRGGRISRIRCIFQVMCRPYVNSPLNILLEHR
jgi:hypothetical protein